MEEQILIFWNLKKIDQRVQVSTISVIEKCLAFIGITKKENSRLIDKSGREGFVANDAYRAMKTMLMEFFKQIAKEKYGTNSEQRKEQKEQNKRKKRERI